MKIHACDQRTPEWYQLRAGKLTGSVASDMLATIRSGGESAKRRDLRTRIVAERLTGQSQENGYINDEMRRGIEKEQDALNAYEALTGEIATVAGFLEHDALPAGHSPDGLIGDDGLLELKVPKTATHVGYIRSGLVPSEHRAQLIHGLWISGRAWADFLSFDDRLPTGLQTFLVRLKRDDVAKEIEDYERKAIEFLNECDDELKALKRFARIA